MASIVEQRLLKDILTTEGKELLENQKAAFAARLRFRTGELVDSRKAEVSMTGDFSGVLSVSHSAHERFLDMKRLKYGSTEVVRNLRIHNRIVWFYFDRISYLAGKAISDAIAKKIESILNNDGYGN